MREKKESDTRLKSKLMQAMVEAALEGHQIGEWQTIGKGHEFYQAICRQCHQPALVSATAAFVIPGRCPG